MNDKYKKLTVQLSDILQEQSQDFIIECLLEEGDQETSDLINLILSSHLSSSFTLMRQLSDTHPPMLDMVNNFIRDITLCIGKTSPITNIEVI